MCLQWCHVRSWLIDNDLPCQSCSLGEPALLPRHWSCVTCSHHLPQDNGGAMCELTREALPLSARCCHWNVSPETAAVLHLADAHLAPWLLGSIVNVFDASETAPPIGLLGAGEVVVQLDELSVPLVYGVPADAWDTALGWQERGWPALSALDTTWQQAITDLLYALDDDAAVLEAALDCIRTLLHAAPLPAEVQAILAPLLDLVRAQHGADASIQTVLAGLETMSRDVSES